MIAGDGHPRHIVTVSALVSDENGAVLLIRSPRRGWEFPGGQVEEGETLTDALHREVREETGVHISIRRLAGVYSNISPPPKVNFGFLAVYRAGELRTSDESLATIWCPRDDVLARITHPAIRDRMRDLLQADGRVCYRVYTSRPYAVLAEHWL